MKKSSQSKLLLLEPSQGKTTTYEINTYVLKNLQTILISLIVATCVLTVIGLTAGIKYFSSLNENKVLHEQVKFLDGYTSSEATAKIQELQKSEKSIQELENYLQERGAHNPPPKVKEGVTGSQGMGGQFQPISNPTPFMGNFSENTRQLLQNIQLVPVGVPHNGQLNSRFGVRNNPFGGSGGEEHKGLDFKGAIGEPVRTTAGGEVVQAGVANGYGNAVKIKHGFNYETLYGHLSAVGVKVGQRVNAGDEIGKLGNTGRSTGPHLHYEVRLSGVPVDPERFLSLAR